MNVDISTLITIGAAPASDSWGFVGVVSVGEHEAYRTMRAYPTPGDAVAASERLLGEVLGALIAGQEWRSAVAEFGHTPQRTELGLGLRPSPDGPASPDGTGSADGVEPTIEVPARRRPGVGADQPSEEDG